METILKEAVQADSEANARRHSFLVGSFPEHLQKAAEQASKEWEEFLNGEAERPGPEGRELHGEN